MPLHPNAELLKKTLESMPLLNSRFSSIKLVNYNSATGEKRGCFSLVFKALDRHTNRHVAIKFYDPDPRWQADIYRVRAFRRENEILKGLITVERCLQLVQELASFPLEYEIAGIKGVVLQCEYFVVDWLDEEIDHYFLSSKPTLAEDRLRLFNEIMLSVETLHRHEVFHRDLKADNLRAYHNALKRLVVAIDLGTAARFDSGCISGSYHGSVGAPAYAAPEALCGMAGNRILAPYNDNYAIGCLLYELFNPDYFYQSVRSSNPGYDGRLAAMAADILGVTDTDKQLKKWTALLGIFSKGVTPVNIAGLGSTAPKAVANILNEVLTALTHLDFRNRKLSTDWVRRKIWSAIRVLENERESARLLKLAKERRSAREFGIQRRVVRLELALNTRRLDVNSQAP